jgi:hypothetical protein
MVVKVVISKMNRKELISKIFESRNLLEGYIKRVRDDQKELLILHGEWSIKDLIGHLGFWENRIVNMFSLMQDGQSPEPFSDMDGLNLQALQETRAQTLETVVYQERAAYEKILGLVDSASEDELFDPNYFAWTAGASFADMISDNTWGHYDEHAPEIHSWLNRIA